MAVPHAVNDQGRGHGRRILVCDGDEITANLLQSVAEQAGYTVEVVRNGRVALDRLRNRSFHLLVLDLALPDIDGLEILKAVRIDLGLNSLHALVLSSRGANEDIFNSYACGANIVLTKPITAEELAALL